MLADFSVQKSKCIEKRKKVIRKLKMPPNQHASRQPAHAGRASLVKRMLAGLRGAERKNENDKSVWTSSNIFHKFSGKAYNYTEI
jgi:hypothetical protein